MDTLLTVSPDMPNQNIICTNELIPLKLGLISLSSILRVKIRFSENNVTEASIRQDYNIMKALKLIKIPFRGYQIILAQEDSQVEAFSLTLQKKNEGSFDNTRIEQLNGNTGSDLIDMMEKMSLLVDASEHAK